MFLPEGQGRLGALPETALRIFVLGTPRIEWQGQALAIPRRAVRALLFRLAADIVPLPRDRLCLLFWPDQDDSTARRNLSHLLTHLRRALPDLDLVQGADDSIRLHPQRVWCDALAFQDLSQEIHNPRDQARDLSNPRVALSVDLPERLQAAVDLYRGSFLSGFSLHGCVEFQNWVTLEERFFEQCYLANLLELMGAYQARQEVQAAIACGQRYLAVDELAEDVHRKLIELYSILGDRGAAQRQFEACLSVLERDLGVSPLPETWSVYRSVLDGLPLAKTIQRGLAPRVAPVPETPFLGREAPLASLHNAYYLARSGQGRLALIAGEQGIGKSRLMHAFMEQLKHQATLLFNACQPGARTLPLQPVAEALRGWMSKNVDPTPPGLPAIWLAEVSRLLPELHTFNPKLPPPLPMQAEEARTRLFEALRLFVLALAAENHPVALFLDDLQWADAITLHWLAYLGGRLAAIQPTGLLVVAAFRSEEADLLAELRQALSDQGVMDELTLGGLSEAHVLQLVRHQFGSKPGDQVLAAQLWRICSGNPFFVQETLNTFAEAGALPKKTIDLQNLPLPETVWQAIRQRLARLAPAEQQVLEAAAVLGDSFGFDLLRATSGRSDVETLDVLETLLRRKLLDEQEDRFTFHHEQVRSAVYSQLSHWRQRLLHRRAAQALQELQTGDPARLAWHFERGGERTQAAIYALLAGEQVTHVFAYNEARDFFTRGLNLLIQEAAEKGHPAEKEHPSELRQTDAAAENRRIENIRLRTQALSKLSWVHRLLGDMASYERDLEEEARLAAHLGDPHLLASVHLRTATAHRWFCRYEDARRSALEGLKLSREAGEPLLEARAYRDLGLVAREQGEFEQAEEYLLQAFDLFAQLKDRQMQLHGYSNLCTLYGYKGEHERALELARQALSYCEQSNLPFDRRLALGDMGVEMASLGEYHQGRACLLESLEITHQIADRTQEIFCLSWLGWLELRAGNLTKAQGHLHEGLALAERLDSRSEQSRMHASLAEVYHLSRESKLAAQHAHRALELAQAYQRAYDEARAQKILDQIL